MTGTIVVQFARKNLLYRY